MVIMGFTLFRLPRPYPTPSRALQLLSILILLAVFAMVARRANGYALEGSSWPAGTIVTFQMGLGSAGRTLIDGNTSWNTAAAPALAAWNNVMARLQYNGNVASPPVSSGDRVNAIVFSNTVFGQRFGSGTLAVTSWRSSGSNIIEADVLFNRNQSFDSYRGPLRFGSNRLAIGDIRRVLIHELGHALGLDHPDDHGQHVDAIMNSMTSNRETLSSDDIAGAQALYGAPTPLAVPEATPTPLYDFNGDGEPDYLLYNVSTRQTAVWYLNNNAFVAGTSAPTLPANWIVVGVADFNGDSQSDYLLYNVSTRHTAVWYLNNNVFVGGAFGPTLPANWKVVGVADFDADGRPDYLLFNSTSHQTAIWYLSGTTFVSSAFGPSLPNGWDLVAVGDFNADGKPDYVLYSPAYGQTAIWYLNNNAFVSGVFGPTLPANFWRVVGVADFNGDNKPDYLLYNASTRQTAIWYLSGPTLISGAYGPMIASGYTLIGAADFNADGKPDYVLYRPSVQGTTLWYLDNNVFTGSANGPTASGWLELDSALSKRTQTSALAPPASVASAANTTGLTRSSALAMSINDSA